MNGSYFRRFKETVDERRIKLQWHSETPSGRRPGFDEAVGDVFEEPLPPSEDAKAACKAWLTKLEMGDEFMDDSLKFMFMEIADDDWKHLSAMPCLRSLSIQYNMSVSGTVIRHLSCIPKLSTLDLSCSNTSRDALKALSQLRELRELNLDNTIVSDADLALLAELPHLRFLTVSGTGITDAGLAHLERLDLQLLDLKRTRVSDAGLASLKKMSVLRTLILKNTEVTKAGIQELNDSGALPLCEVMGNSDVVIQDSFDNQREGERN